MCLQGIALALLATRAQAQFLEVLQTPGLTRSFLCPAISWDGGKEREGYMERISEEKEERKTLVTKVLGWNKEVI